MNLFKEVADIKTADQLNLPTPEVEYHNIVAQPTEHQQEMVKALSERASQVHSGSVDPSEDNMLKITSDGRKLGLDQRIVNQMLPDEPGTKVNQCVDNICLLYTSGFCGGVEVRAHHTAVFTVVHLPVYNGIGIVLHIGVGRNGGVNGFLTAG